MPTTSFKREFCRSLFEDGSASDASRHAILTGIRKAAQKTLLEGKSLVSTMSDNTSATFQFIGGWDVNDVMALIDEARAWADAPDVDTALAMISGPIKSTRFQCALER